jgi:hypothetical protein
VQSGLRNTGIWPVNPHIFKDFSFTSAETTNKPDPNPNENQYWNTKTSEEVPCYSSSYPEAEQSGVTSIQCADQEIHVNIPSRETQNKLIQTISRVPLTSSNAAPPPSKERKTVTYIHCVKHQSLCWWSERKGCRRKIRELINLEKQVPKTLQLDSEVMFQEEIFDCEKCCPWLYCNEVTSTRSLEKLGFGVLSCGYTLIVLD